MTSTRNLSELEKLEFYKIALMNAKEDASINQAFVDIRFSNKMLDEGINLYTLASEAYENAKQARRDRDEAYMLYDQKVNALEEQFRIDWKIAKIAFLDDLQAKNILHLDSTFLQGRLKQFEQASIFYKSLLKQPELLDAVSKLYDGDKGIAKSLEILSETEKAKLEYYMEKSKAKIATEAKKDSMKVLSRWMTQYISIAKIALKNMPQFLVSLGLDK
jgi:hypothetical protein